MAESIGATRFAPAAARALHLGADLDVHAHSPVRIHQERRPWIPTSPGPVPYYLRDNCLRSPGPISAWPFYPKTRYGASLIRQLLTLGLLKICSDLLISNFIITQVFHEYQEIIPIKRGKIKGWTPCLCLRI